MADGDTFAGGELPVDRRRAGERDEQDRQACENSGPEYYHRVPPGRCLAFDVAGGLPSWKGKSDATTSTPKNRAFLVAEAGD